MSSALPNWISALSRRAVALGAGELRRLRRKLLLARATPLLGELRLVAAMSALKLAALFAAVACRCMP
jgi:hypothetical protein